ncbi:hypothetical protein LCGC14_1438840 [marine sediment metagenome]|uniref:Uncharacterized protein n=1 Tax=marine sediment metagenome TaxID=412755 RepID=A0A0F9M1T9_9ZZZZ|nr:hypothetical protein [Candidatus Scalindua sediminis]HDY68686.1 hypothetical protein [Candidatus Scalindua sp.]
MKKVIIKSLLVFTMMVFMASSAMAAKPEDVIDKSNVFPSGKHYAMNMTGKSGKGKEASTTTELQTVNPSKSSPDSDDESIEQLRMILLLMCMPGFWESIPTNTQLR